MTRGPLPQPDLLKALRGNPGKRPLSMAESLQPPVRVPDPPDWLNADAAAEWQRLTLQLVELGLVADIDLGSLTIYCQTWGDLCELERTWSELKRKAREVHQGREAPAVMITHIVTTPSGIKRPSPLYERIRDLRADLDRMSRNFGGSPAARARVQASSEFETPDGGAPPLETGQPAEARPATGAQAGLTLVQGGFTNFR